MTALRWAGVLLAGLIAFIAVGGGATLLFVRYGWELFGWHTTLIPEVMAGGGVGALAGLAVIILLGSRVSRGTESLT